MLERWRANGLQRLAVAVSHRPRVVLVVAVLMAGVSVAAAVGWLAFHSNRNDLIAKDIEWNQWFVDWVETFAGTRDFVLVVDTHGPDGTLTNTSQLQAQAFVDDVVMRLTSEPTVELIVHGYDPALVSGKGIRMLAWDDFAVQIEDVAQSQLLLESATLGQLIERSVGKAVGDFALTGSAELDAKTLEQARRGLVFFAELLEASGDRLGLTADEPMDLSNRVGGESKLGDWQYLATPNGRFLIVRITPIRDARATATTPYAEALVAVRKHLAESERLFPEVDSGLTGIEVIEADETAAVERDTTWASVVAFVLIAILLVVGLHSIRMPILLLISLLIAIAWTFGYATIAVGYLQVISIVFTVMLMGLGVAFGVHVVSRFELVRHRFPDTEAGFRRSLANVLRVMGPGLVTGAITTSAAFATTLLTDFKGVAEMGHIAAVGVLLCLLSMMVVFPALLRLFKKRHKSVVPMQERRVYLFHDQWFLFASRRPWLVVILGAGLTLASGVGALRMSFDYNLLSLLPQKMESYQWQQKVVHEGDLSIYFAASVMSDMETAQQWAVQYQAMDMVESLGGVGMLFPPDDERKVERIESLPDSLAISAKVAMDSTANDAVQSTEVVRAAEALGLLLGLAGGRLPAELEDEFKRLQQATQRLSEVNQSLDAVTRERRMLALHRDYHRWRQTTGRKVLEVLDTSAIGLTDFPVGLFEPYVLRNEHGEVERVYMEIYGNVPAEIPHPLDPRFLGPFIEDVRQVDAEATGVVVQVLESGNLIRLSYLWAGVYAFGLVLVIVWIDFRRLDDACLALLPVGVGFVMTFGLLHAMGQSVNPANIIVLPLLFGIGVDSGVHVMHRFRMNQSGRPLGLTSGTGKGITLTSLTAMIGFGSLTLADHRGIESLGLTLTMGVGLTLLACLVLMPAVLELRLRYGRSSN